MARRSNRDGTYAELLTTADDVIEEGVAGAEVLREADVLLLPLGLPHHLQRQTKTSRRQPADRLLARPQHEQPWEPKGKAREQTRKSERPLGAPVTRRTPPSSRILQARSMFLPNRWSRLHARQNRSGGRDGEARMNNNRARRWRRGGAGPVWIHLHGQVLAGGVPRNLDLHPHGVGHGEGDAGSNGHLVRGSGGCGCGGSRDWWVTRTSRFMFCCGGEA